MFAICYIVKLLSGMQSKIRVLVCRNLQGTRQKLNKCQYKILIWKKASVKLVSDYIPCNLFFMYIYNKYIVQYYWSVTLL